MSFLSIVKAILPSLGKIEVAVAPIAERLFPAEAPLIAVLDGWVHRTQTSIAAAEASSPTGGAAVKSSSVVADFEAGLSMTQEILSLTGQELIYDHAALQAAIDAQVAAFNAFAKVKASFVIQKKSSQPAAQAA